MRLLLEHRNKKLRKNAALKSQGFEIFREFAWIAYRNKTQRLRNIFSNIWPKKSFYEKWFWSPFNISVTGNVCLTNLSFELLLPFNATSLLRMIVAFYKDYFQTHQAKSFVLQRFSFSFITKPCSSIIFLILLLNFTNKKKSFMLFTLLLFDNNTVFNHLNNISTTKSVFPDF